MATAPPHLMPWLMLRDHAGPTCPAVWLHNRERVVEAVRDRRTWTQGCIWAEGVKQLLTPVQAAHPQISAYSQHKLSAHTGPFMLQPSPALGQRSSAGRGERKHLKGTEPAWARLSGFLLQQFGMTLPPVGWWQPLSRGDILPTTWLQL